MSKEYSKKDFNLLMEEFQALHDEKPKKVERESYYSLLKMGKVRVEGFNKFKSSLSVIFVGLIIIMCIFTAIFDPTSIPITLFGIIFFCAGYFITMSDNGEVLFLFSHGLVGFCVMNRYSFVKIVSNPVITDNPTKIFILLGLAVVLELASLTYGAIYSSSKELKMNPVNKCIPFALAALSTIIIQTLAILLNL